ncbi:MAG: multidrug effflux MFS transporter [Gammaproteobacteria bacterium]|nr:multidrug effflux MFS transporter [Gammaproteobacteria bacterium]
MWQSVAPMDTSVQNNQTVNPPKHLTLIVALLTMIGPFTIDTYLPSFPAIEAEYGISRGILSQSLAFYLAAFAISTLFWGPLSDRLGRRTVVLATLFLYLLASIGCALATDYTSFLFFRLLQGVAAGGGLAAGRTMIRDVYNPQDAQRAMSRVMMMFAIAPAVAPIVGGALHEAFGWRSVFYFLAIYSALVFLVVSLRVPETLPLSMRQSFHPLNVLRVYGNTLVHRRFQSLVFIVACNFGGMFMYIAGAPTVIFDFLKTDVHDFGIMFSSMVGGMIVGAWLSGNLAHRWHAQRTVGLALILITLGTVLNVAQALLLSPQLLTTILPLMLYTFGMGIATPAMTVLSLDCFPKNRGAASAAQGFVQMMGNAAIASLAIPLLQIHVEWMALGQLALVVTALILWWFLPPLIDQNNNGKIDQ